MVVSAVSGSDCVAARFERGAERGLRLTDDRLCLVGVDSGRRDAATIRQMKQAVYLCLGFTEAPGER